AAESDWAGHRPKPTPLYSPAIARHAEAAEGEAAMQLGGAAVAVAGAERDVERHQVILGRMRHLREIERAAIGGEGGKVVGGERLVQPVLEVAGPARGAAALTL